MTIALAVDNLYKSFGQVKAVEGLSFNVQKGSCFGLLGPNGAGKTTTLEMLEGLLQPDSGKVDFPLLKNGQSLASHIGIQFQETALQDNMQVGEALRLFGALYGQEHNLQELIRLCSLEEFLIQDTKKISGGQRQRLLLAIALIHNPEIVFLDEPTTGLDPQSRRNFWQLMQNIKAKGKTLVLTTHYMDEAYQLCDEIVIVDHGKIIEQGIPSALLQKHFSGALIRLPKVVVAEHDLPFSLLNHNADFVEFNSTQVDKDLRILMEKNISLEQLYIHKPNLDDLFLKLTGQELRG